MDYKVGLVSLGCSKNTIDSELIKGILKAESFIETEELLEADVIIINTCGFIEDAKRESIENILELSNLKEEGNCKALIVAGCLSERYKDQLLEEIPEIDGVIGTGNVEEISEVVKRCLKGEKVSKFGSINSEYLERSERILLEESHTAYVKISEGCDNLCTYCIIPKLRGKYRSRKIENIVKETERLVSNGVKEVILIAQDTSKYGTDLYGENKLPELLRELGKIEKLKWIRMLYIYPETFNDKIIQEIKTNSKVVKYVDIPIQHISNSVLKRMNRTVTKGQITTLIDKLRKEIEGIVIRTTLIVGFPGETETDFEELKEYVKEMKFERLGTFKYSKEEDTPAAKMENQIEEEIKEERYIEIMKIQETVSTNIMDKKIGKEFEVLIEENPENGVYIGRTYMDSPEIDGVFYVNSEKKLNIGDFYICKVTEALEYDLIGEI